MTDPVLSSLLRINRQRIKTLRRTVLNPNGYVGVMHLIVLYAGRHPGASQEDVVAFFALDKASVARGARRLEELGYGQYEISNYALPGYECRHNLGYWDRTEYLGIGLGASSLLHNRRWDFGEEPVALSIQEQMEEYMFLGLRKTEGVSRSKFAGEFGRGLDEVYGNVLRKMYELGLMEETGDLVRLTERGIDVSNMVMCEFLLG